MPSATSAREPGDLVQADVKRLVSPRVETGVLPAVGVSPEVPDANRRVHPRGLRVLRTVTVVKPPKKGADEAISRHTSSKRFPFIPPSHQI